MIKNAWHRKCCGEFIDKQVSNKTAIFWSMTHTALCNDSLLCLENVFSLILNSKCGIIDIRTCKIQLENYLDFESQTHFYWDLGWHRGIRY